MRRFGASGARRHILHGKMPLIAPHVARKTPVLPAETVVLNLRHRRNGG
jgi:hypothetical protein